MLCFTLTLTLTLGYNVAKALLEAGANVEGKNKKYKRQKTKYKRQKTKDKRQKTKDRRQKTEDKKQKTKDKKQRRKTKDKFYEDDRFIQTRKDSVETRHVFVFELN